MSRKQGQKNELSQPKVDGLFQRVAAILDQARGHVVRSVNSNMVLAYWLIGREIVEELQGSDERAEYGKQVVENLSDQLTQRYGKGFSTTNLWSFQQFFQVFANRMEILSPSGRESDTSESLHQMGGESSCDPKRYPAGSESPQGFFPLLSWSHYRALMRVQDIKARDFHERQAAECGWTTSQLEWQIQSSYFQRIITNRGEAGLVTADQDRLLVQQTPVESPLKAP
jgi:hypothetical protein